MKIKFNREIRLLARIDCCRDLWDREQEWEFDAGEELVVRDIVWSQPKKFKPGGKKAILMRFADIFLMDGNDDAPDYLHMVPDSYFDVVE